jgi:two-component system, LytTR family, response regulator
LDKIRIEITKNKALQTLTKPQPDLLHAARQVFLKDGEKCYFVRLGDVSLIESVGNYVRLHFGAQNALLHRSLNQLEARLDSSVFFRANRQEIVNIEEIIKVEPFFNGTLRFTLRNGRLIEVSTRQAVVFRERMSL